MTTKILVINSGSSSIKFELFSMPDERPAANGLLQRIGEPESELALTVGDAEQVVRQPVPDHGAGLRLITEKLTDSEHGGVDDIGEIRAVGHRVVHGGEAFAETVVIDDAVVEAIERYAALAPLHNPPNLMGIKVARELLPDVPQVAVFDTAFHQTIPGYAYTYPLPFELYEKHHVRRYGFHGTSHRFVAQRACELLGREAGTTNLISCHLGNGASITAIQRGRSMDTSMGLTPLEGLVMGTRCGDIDPAIAAFLARAEGLSMPEIDKLFNKKSGLLGLSGVSNDVRALLAAEREGDQRAALALAVYCYRLKKYISAYTGVLGEVAALIFTAGVGENAPSIRERTLAGLDRIGYALDAEKNQQAVKRELDIASDDSPARILVIPTDEELMIARDTYRVAFG